MQNQLADGLNCNLTTTCPIQLFPLQAIAVASRYVLMRNFLKCPALEAKTVDKKWEPKEL